MCTTIIPPFAEESRVKCGGVGCVGFQEGFGAGFEGDTPYKTQNGDCLCIRGGNAHQQVTAPGYEMYYVWLIRHLDGDPWDKTRIYVPEYEWLANAD